MLPGNAEKCRENINQWVSKHTSGKIPKAVGENDVTSATSMVIVNCIYFKGKYNRLKINEKYKMNNRSN